ncbi:Leucine Rich Repeat domain protein [Aspergillus clavatus NRRL 1]|uniref:Leucine Rich Repeat domain protein n=1 Tax=Aspergillus clavatus (strain ATCC 1007 / CBS 513.65 / DSM 816 / NCTC 3887 / NRRL 1 / QM 1276 / 107) TaxID=344612 RepID=A1CI99_ASPCL|nr:Leucine Rich Repeat domain protein [Aspergillus clavatus NRRL 1]EAW10604.1 Leucine Rich Repeat domain protein [Aspergillus clavatus NRRL 1]
MSSAATSSAVPLHKPHPLPRFTTTAPSLDTNLSQQQSQSVSPHSSTCSSPNGSRSSSRRRPSFGSIKEDVDGIAQSFVDTHIDQSPAEQSKPSSPLATDMQHTPDFCCPCGGFLGWKQIRLGGKSLSRSYGDLRSLGSMHTRGWAWEKDAAMNNLPMKTVQLKSQKPPPGSSPLEKLPPEVLDQIISNLALDIPPNGYTPRNVDLVACLLTSRTLHAATLAVLYRNMTFPHSIIFSKALNHMSQYPALGTLVRRLDFSHFTSVGLGRTKQMNAEIQNLTSTTLLKCLDLLPNLRECLLQEHVEGDISVEIVQKVFTGLPNLQGVDFCGCATQSFSAVFNEALTTGLGLPLSLPNLKRLSLHECSSLPPSTFELLLPRLINLTHLDVTHTQINEAALFSIPATAQITHLSLSRCIRLQGSRVVDFLSTHPAVCQTLVYLNLLTDPTRYRLLEEEDIAALLPNLPTTLRSLNLGGAKITSDHAAALLPLTKHLEELGLSSADLSCKDLNSFFAPPPPPSNCAPVPEAAPVAWEPSSLCYLDLTKVPSLTIGTVFNTNACLLLSQQSWPLQVIEFSDKIIAPLRERIKNNRPSSGWTIRELGRRGWYVRDPASMPSQAPDDGSRSWKMGARWWGMRKIPVAVGDVGGIYGHYMFKK